MKIASYNTFSSDVINHGLEYALNHTKDLGFDGIELIHIRGELPHIEAVKRARERFDAYDLPVVCYSVYADLSVTEQELMQHAQIAAAFGSPFLHHTLAPRLYFTPEAPDYDEIFDRIVDAAERIANYCATLGLTCLYEPQGIYFNGTDGLGRFFREMKRRCDNVGICADIGNPMFVHAEPTDIFSKFEKDIKHIHVKNYLISQEEKDGLECYQIGAKKWLCDVDIQHGNADIGACLSKLPHYNGFISIEKHSSDETVKGFIEYIKNFEQ